MKKYRLFYNSEAPFGNEDYLQYGKKRGKKNTYGYDKEKDIPDDGWEKWSVPLGNGYMGANVFGRTHTERIQITENSLSNPYAKGAGGLNSFLELYLELGHENVSDYIRGLDLNKAVSFVEYNYNGAKYKREYFTSYPDKVLVIRLSCSEKGKLSFTVRPQIPYVKPFLLEENDGMGKSGEVSVSKNRITVCGEMEYYKIKYEGQIFVKSTGGYCEDKNKSIAVKNADEALIIMALGTNYRLESRVFTEENPKKKLKTYPHPHDYVTKTLNKAKQKSYDELFYNHVNDYSSLFNRASIDLGEENDGITTDELLERYKTGKKSRYLEELYFQYGRYLLISSSRPKTYPANLQGTWNRYDSSPWSCGYWHNINVQMNYWPALNTNLSQTFLPYSDYFKAYFPLTKKYASEYIKKYFPQNYSEKDGENGWIIGTGAWLYTVMGMEDPFCGHSGPGVGAFTSKMLWEYYAFTMDKEYLSEVAYPALLGMSAFLSKVLIERDSKYLVKYSASPEQVHNGEYYYTTGCAFDQQMVYENYKDTLEAARILGRSDEILGTIKQQIDKLDHVLVGKSGQIKEFREEENYGDIGEYHHRHISQLIGLCPGTSINRNNPDWLKAAEYTLNERGDESTGWSTAHKMNAWARLKNGKRAYDLLNMMLSKCTLNNLWDTHPPFQIDGNFGACAGICEMLLQSHEGYLHILPALPEEWKNGSFKGLMARGAFEVSAKWQNMRLSSLTIKSQKGGRCKLYIGEGYNSDKFHIKDGFIEFESKADTEYNIILT